MATATKTQPAPKAASVKGENVRSTTEAFNPVHPDNRSAQPDDEAYLNHFVDVDGGEHKGAFGVLEEISKVDKDGKPLVGLVREHGVPDALLQVEYKDLRPASRDKKFPA